MPDEIPSSEALRETLQAHLDARRLTVAQVAERAKISGETVYALLRGKEVAATSRRLIHDAIRVLTDAQMSDSTIAIPRETLAYWRGRFDTMAEWFHAIDSMMQQQREQFARATQGVSDFRDSGVLLPVPPVPPTDRPRISPEELRGRGEDGGEAAGGQHVA